MKRRKTRTKEKVKKGIQKKDEGNRVGETVNTMNNRSALGSRVLLEKANRPSAAQGKKPSTHRTGACMAVLSNRNSSAPARKLETEVKRTRHEHVLLSGGIVPRILNLNNIRR
jgi:hypothetical protein